MFCQECGAEINDNAKFCPECGTPVKSNRNQESYKSRDALYAGKIIKCPSCGNVLNSYDTLCPQCGHEIRDAKVSSAISEFTSKLEQIEAGREEEERRKAEEKAKVANSSKKKNKKNEDDDQEKISVTDQKKINLIRNFSVPNSKEDMYEFFVLAASNIDMDTYSIDGTSHSEKEISQAWEAKYNQTYNKAKMAFGGTPEFHKFEEIYNRKSQEINTKKKIRIIFYSVMSVLVVCFWIFLIVFSSHDSSNDYDEIKEENTRLEAVVNEVYDALGEENYTLARAKASSLHFSVSTTITSADDARKEWDKTREELMKTIDKAEVASDNRKTEKTKAPSREDSDNNSSVDDESETAQNIPISDDENSEYYSLVSTEYNNMSDGSGVVRIDKIVGKKNSHVERSIILYSEDNKVVGKASDDITIVEGETNYFRYEIEGGIEGKTLKIQSSGYETTLDGSVNAVKMTDFNLSGDKVYITFEQVGEMGSLSKFKLLFYNGDKLVGSYYNFFDVSLSNLTGAGSTDVLDLSTRNKVFDKIEFYYEP